MNLSMVKVGQSGSEMVKELLKKYFTEELEALSPLTIRARSSDLKKFIQFYYSLYRNYDLSVWYPRDTRAYIDNLTNQNYSPNYINRNIGSLRNFGYWLFINKLINQNPVKHIKEIKLDDPTPKAIDDLTLNRIFKVADQLAAKPRSKDTQDNRNIALIQVLLKSGLRIEEVLRLKLNQLVGSKFTNVISKGGKIRAAVSINKETAELIQSYLTNYRTPGSDFLFTNRYGNRLSRNGVARAINKICSVASATFSDPAERIHIHPHLFRHTHARRFYEKTLDPVLTARRLGHSGIGYVARYATPNEEDINKVIESL